jgi:6-phospho-3-hexuloisomerase
MKITEYMQNALAEQNQMLGRIDERQVQEMADAINGADKLYTAGAGRSGLIMKTFCMRCMHMGMRAYVVGETVTPAIGKDDFLLIGSGSGETGTLTVVADKARRLGAAIGLVTIYPGSTIGQKADHIITLPGTTFKSDNAPVVTSMQPAGNLFEQTMFLLMDTLVVALLEKRDIKYEDLSKLHANLE